MSTNVLPVLFRPTLVFHQISIHIETTIDELIQLVCQRENFSSPHACFLWYKTLQFSSSTKLSSIELFPIPIFSNDFPEIRFKFIQQLIESRHISQHVLLASPEHIDYHELLSISNPHQLDDIRPISLVQFAEDIHRSRRNERFTWSSISLPVFARQSIDFLPTIFIKIPEILQRDEWKAFVSFITTDLCLRERDLIVVNIRKETKLIEIKLKTNLIVEKKSILKLNKKSISNALKLTKSFFDIQYSQTNGKIHFDLFHFNVDLNVLEERTKISPIFIDLALDLSERLALIDETIDEFLISKTRLITTCLFNSLQNSSAEFVIDQINYLYHHESCSSTLKNEKILFYATPALRLDDIWENFPFLSRNKTLENGPFGDGFYFSSSPKETIEKVQQIPHATIYLLAAIVQLGETIEVTDGENLPTEFDSLHVTNNDEFIVKSAEQIIPIYLVGLRRVDRFIIWRDAKITDSKNVNLYQRLRQHFDFNIYGCQTNVEVFQILTKKLIDPMMKCLVITNGADNGEDFLRQCRQRRADIPAIVFCFNVKHHEHWAKRIPGTKIKVTNEIDEMIVFIEKTFGK